MLSLGKCQRNECIFVPVSTVPWKKSLWRDTQNNKTNSQRWESCALPKAAKKPCCSHWIKCWRCKFQPGWWQNRVQTSLCPDVIFTCIGECCKPTFVDWLLKQTHGRPWVGAVQPFLMYTQLNGLTSALAATHRTACNDTSLVHCSSFSET